MRHHIYKLGEKKRYKRLLAAMAGVTVISSILPCANISPAAAAPSMPVRIRTAAIQMILYQNKKYADWQWSESTYPKDMEFHVFLADPRLAKTWNPATHNDLLAMLNNVDFQQHFVVFAKLGTTASRGYGIGIEKISQLGGTITVTVRLKSPQLTENLEATKESEWIVLDRSLISPLYPLRIDFVDHNNIVLDNRTIQP